MTAKKKKPAAAKADDIVTAGQLAALLGTTEQEVEDGKKDGFIEGALAGGRWDIRKAVPSYLSHLRTRATGTKTALAVARTELAVEQTRNKRFKRGLQEGTYLPGEEVNYHFTFALSTVRHILLADKMPDEQKKALFDGITAAIQKIEQQTLDSFSEKPE